VAHCSFLLVGPSYFDRSDHVAVGLFKYESFDGDCVGWTNVSAVEKTARAFGTLAALLTGLGLVMVTLMVFLINVKIQNTLWMIVRINYICALLAQIITFAFFGSDICIDNGELNQCSPGAAGIIGILNVILLIVLCVLTWMIKAPEAIFNVCASNVASQAKPQNNVCEEHIVVEETEHDIDPSASEPQGADATESIRIVTEIGADGTKKTTKTVTNPDGTKSITTVIEKSA